MHEPETPPSPAASNDAAVAPVKPVSFPIARLTPILVQVMGQRAELACMLRDLAKVPLNTLTSAILVGEITSALRELQDYAHLTENTLLRLAIAQDPQFKPPQGHIPEGGTIR